MPFVPDTAPEAASAPRGRFVPDAPPPAAPEPLPARVPGTSIGLGIPGVDPEWAAGRAPEQVASRQRQEAAARNPIRDGVVGLVEGALDTVAKVVGGGVGGIGGLWYGVLTGEGKNAPEKMVEGAQRGVGVVRDIYRQTRLTSGGEPETEFGRTLTGLVDRAAEVFPSVGTGPRGTLVNPMPEGAMRGVGQVLNSRVPDAARAISRGVAELPVQAVPEVVRQAGGKVRDAALEAATPQLSKRSLEIAGKAVDAGIPLSPHQLINNKFVQILGETAENVPYMGGGSLRAKRREAYFGGLAKQMDPETDITVLDDAGFKALQDAAGKPINEISAKYDVPLTEFGDLMDLDRVRRGTPETKAVVQAWADDLKKIAEENGGVVPGRTLRELRTEVQNQARELRSNKAELASRLDDVVHQLDEALEKVAKPEDIAVLKDARRRYAISKVLEPLVGRHPDGNIPLTALSNIMAQKSGGKQRRTARGEAGELGEYARLGKEYLKEPPSSGTAERNSVYSAVGVGAGAGAAFTEPLSAVALGGVSALYNFAGPRIVKAMVNAQRRRDAPTPEGRPPEPTLGRGFEDVPQRPEPGGEAPLGDLTPEWGTTPGAAPAAAGGMDPAGLVPALGEEAPSTGTRVDMRTRAGQEIPAVPGRPDLPDTLVSGAPAESAATEPANAAMVTPGAIEARRQQGMAAVERAAAAERAEPVPVGEATEITPESVKPAPGMPDEPIPVGEATEITPENVKPAPEVKEHPEVAKIRQDIAKKREAEAKKQAAADELRAAAAAETDPEVKAALIKRADAIAPAKKQEKTDGTPSEPVGTGGVRKEAGQEGVPKDGDAGAQVAKGGEEALDLGLPKIDEGLLDLQQRAAERATPPPAPSPRGRRQVRRALERGMADGTLNKDGASLALWALDRNENLARGLRVEVLQPEPGAGGKGSYNSATRIAKLFQGEDNPQTAMHEILHHAERMMPDAVQQGIYRAWQRALKAAMKDATPERTKAMEALNRASSGDKAALTEAKQAFDSGVLSEDDYQFVNPTEYWAVNGARIMHERFTGRGSWRAQARQWMREMIEHVKGTVGIRSDSPLLKTLNEMLDPAKTTGAQKSPTMIKDRPEGGGSLTSTKERK